MTTKPPALADQVSDIVSTTIKRVRESFANRDSPPKAPSREERDEFFFAII
jgi:hypothetical protein